MVNEAGRARVKRAVEARMRAMKLNNTDLAALCDNKPDAGAIGEFRTTARWFSTRNLGKIQTALEISDDDLAAMLEDREPPSEARARRAAIRPIATDASEAERRAHLAAAVPGVVGEPFEALFALAEHYRQQAQKAGTGKNGYESANGLGNVGP